MSEAHTLTPQELAIQTLAGEGKSRVQIARALNLSAPTVTKICDYLGIKLRDGRVTGVDMARDKSKRRYANSVRAVSDRRRYLQGSAPTGEAGNLAPHGARGTQFPKTVRKPDESDTILKDGKDNRKIGGDVLVGKLKGAKIFTLTLEERATCPKDCAFWRGCYGNSMPYSTRWEPTKTFFNKLSDEVAKHCRKGPILIRLHVLGDFFAISYVEFWAGLLRDEPNLNCFGFTAWKPGSEIGDAVGIVRDAFPGRFMIRHSDTLGSWGSAVFDFPTEAKTIGGGIVCPEQRDHMAGVGLDLDDERNPSHCGDCAACWSCDRTIFFVQHGAKGGRGQ